MLKYEDLVENFSDVLGNENGIVICEDEFPKVTTRYYFKLANEATGGYDLVVICESKRDDEFAKFVLSSSMLVKDGVRLSICPLGPNKYGFTNLVLAPKDFHGYLKGRLDDERDRLVLCLPIHQGEFSGSESIDDFFLLRREIVDTLNWERKPSPQVQIRFDNPQTGVGTAGAYVLVKYEYLLREIDKLEGIGEGFIEILNYLGAVAEILSHAADQFVLILDRDDSARELMNKQQLIERVYAFLRFMFSGICLEANMNQSDQFEIINRILQTVFDVVPSEWRELMINYHIEGTHSSIVNTVLITKDGRVTEESIPYQYELDGLLIELQKHLAQAGKPEFTNCKIHVKSDGQYEITYGYDKVDWDALLRPDWNFFPAQATQK